MKQESKTKFEPAQMALPLNVPLEWITSAPSGFWAKVNVGDDNQCWPWLMSLNDGGYGNFWHDGMADGSHRVAFRAAYGEMPVGFETGHNCHNAACCNPRHMEPKTRKQNMAEKGERLRGRVLRVLTAALVSAARLMVAAGAKIADVAKKIRVKADTLRCAVRGITWAHVQTPPVTA